MDSVTEARTEKPQKPNHRVSSSAFPYLPFELIREILARLPAKSLLQFKTVCKSWLSLISCNEFVRKQCAQSYYSSSMTSKRLIMNTPKSKEIICYAPNSRPQEIPIDVLIQKVDHSCKAHHQDKLEFSLIGSCDGLVCVEIRDSCNRNGFFYWNPCDSCNRNWVFLWNPCTRGCVEVEQCNLEGNEFMHLQGFGYDYNSDDYKVLGVICTGETATRISMIYTLRTNSWRRIQDHPPGTLVENGAIYITGALIWSANTTEKGPVTIISLDLTSETYMEVPQPDYGENALVPWKSVGTLEGCLCVLVLSVGSRIQNDIWVMRGYGIKESWTKLFSVPHLLGSVLFRNLTQMIWYLGNDEIVFDFGGEMASYNANTRSTTPLRIPVCGYDRSHVYVESLISLHAYNELRGK